MTAQIPLVGKSLRHNGVISGVEVVVNGICLLVIYRHVAEVLGIGLLGVWGLVLSATGFGRAADLGISGGLSRFVARSIGEERPRVAKVYMRTGVTFMTVAMGAACLALWLPLHLGLEIALSGVDLIAAREVLPWAVLSIWLLMIKTSLDACLVGVQRADLRSIAGICGMLLQVGLSFVLIESYGLVGLAWAQAAQFLLAIGLEGVFLRTVARVTADSTTFFDRSAFRELFRFGLGLQVGSIATLLFDPVVKATIGATYGTHVLGLFESAYRATYQLRTIATTALQPSIPVLTQAIQKGVEASSQTYRGTLRTAHLLATVLMTGAVVGSPILSWLLLRNVDPVFVSIAALLALAWTANIVASPAYYFSLARGRFLPYVLSEFVALVLGPLVIVGASFYGSAWVVAVGVVVAKSAAALVLLRSARAGLPSVGRVVSPASVGSFASVGTAVLVALLAASLL